MTKNLTAEQSDYRSALHNVLEDVLDQVDRAGGQSPQVSLTTRYNPQTGIHIHGTARVTLRFFSSAVVGDKTK